MLSLKCKFHGLLFTQRVRRPQPLEHRQAKVTPERFLDHFAVALSLPRGTHLHKAHDFLVKRQRCSNLRHIRIVASRCADAKMAEREGFEPSRPLRTYGISRAAPSTELGDRSAPNSSNQAQFAFGRATVAPVGLPITCGPSGPPMMHVSAMPMNRPCSTTPI